MSTIFDTPPRRDPSDHIHEAVAADDLEKIRSLIKESPDLAFSTDNHGRTPLHYTAANGSRAAAELLLAANADVNARCKRGYTPLHFAAGNSNKAVAELLLVAKAQINAKANDGATPLHEAASNAEPDMVEFLLGSGADADAIDGYGKTVWDAAARAGAHPGVTKVLLRHKEG